MLTLLFLGDIVGVVGRKAVQMVLPELRKEYSPDLIIANAENAAHGKGITEPTAQELFAAGIDWLTMGDHAFDKPSHVAVCYGGAMNIIRPANYQKDAPGRGSAVIPTAQGDILLVNLLGQVFMSRHFDSPFEKWQEISSLFTGKKFSAIIIDIHAEATSEKIAFKQFIDGQVSALLGTHTHIQTADSHLTSAQTGYITDVGMTGYADGVIGVMTKPVLTTFLTRMTHPHELPETGQAVVQGVKLVIDPATAHCLEIQPFQRSVIVT